MKTWRYFGVESRAGEAVRACQYILSARSFYPASSVAFKIAAEIRIKDVEQLSSTSVAGR